MAKRCRIRELISTAREHGEATASGGRWTARRAAMWNNDLKIWVPGAVIVRHHSTDMIYVDKHNTVYPIDPGWRSQTDKQGINSMLAHEGIDHSYDGLFNRNIPIYCAFEDCSNAALSGSSRCFYHSASKSKPEPEPEPLPRWHPPISVEDTMGIG